jgi:glycerol-3-phosphate dehydrogenase
VNAAGPWANEVSKLAGTSIKMNLSKGIMIAMNIRWTNTIINRLDMPGDGDILVPVGTVCVIGTTSVTVQRPDDNSITPQEVSQMLDEGESMIPGFRKARALRAWAGVRPLYDGEAGADVDLKHDEHHTIVDAEGRFITRSFTVIDHAAEGVSGFLSIVGGKLTTYRQMAERVSDQVCKQLGVDKPCTTASTVLPVPTWAHEQHYHTLTSRLSDLEHASTQAGLICECELVTRPQLEQAIVNSGPSVSLDDLRRDLRLGMGPCQGGFCAYRAAGVLRETCDLPAETAVGALRDFVQERFRGNRPLLWGHQLRQALLDESIYRRTLGLTSQGGEKRALPR